MAATLPIVVRSLGAGYGATRVLHDINLSVQPCEVRAILGPSGCGKTTLLKHLVGLVRPMAGDVQLLGQSLATLTPAAHLALLQRTGMLFQGGALLHGMSVLHNVALPLIAGAGVPQDLACDVARLKLELVHMGHAAHMMPAALSGGMKKRAALARAIALDPEVLFCDEPGAGLDPVMAAELDALILSLRDRFAMTVVVVTHELVSIRRIADRVLMLHQGRAIADGPLDEVAASDHPAVADFFARRRPPQHSRPQSLWQALGGRRTKPGAP